MNYYQFHIADWVLHTSHLTLEEEAVYRRLLDYYYDTEQPIPEITQPVIRRLRLGSYSELVGSILEEFFILRDDGWHNLRADGEILEYNLKAQRARENGKKGGRPKKQKLQKQQDTDEEKPRKTQPVNSGNLEKTGSKANQEPLTNNHKNNNKGTAVAELKNESNESNENGHDLSGESQPGENEAPILRLAFEGESGGILDHPSATEGPMH